VVDNSSNSPILYTPDQLAERLGLSRKTIFNHTVPRGTLRAVRIGEAVRYSPAEVDRWIAEKQLIGAS
jgi:excisionase family DNA binding protein